MTTTDGPEPYEPPGVGSPLDDGPVIDPRDPLGLGDLRLGGPRDERTPDEPDVVTTTLPATTRRARTARPDDAVPDPVPDPVPDALQPASAGTPAAGDVEHAPPVGSSTDVGTDHVAGHVAASHVGDDAADDVVTDAGRDVAGDAADAPVDGDPAAGEETGDGRDVRADVPPGSDDAGGDGQPAPAVRPARSGWARLGHAMRPRTTQGQLITAGLCALLGFALVVQVRQATDTQLGALRQNDLVRLLDETTTRTDELEQESLDLQRERDELLSGSDRQQAALDAARRTAAMQGILTGRLPATGPGVRITLSEPDGEIRPATMLHVLEELRNAGAEAMELNGHRITASSAFTGSRGAIELDGALVESPFRWTVIGDPDTIAPALEIPGGALVRVRADGGRGTVEKSDRVDVTAVRALPDPVHASPVADPG